MLPVRIRQSVVAHFGRARRVSTRAVTSARIYESTSLDPYFNLALEDWYERLLARFLLFDSTPLISSCVMKGSFAPQTSTPPCYCSTGTHPVSS